MFLSTTTLSVICSSDIQGDSLLSSFIYPESRAELLNELGLAGLLCELNIRRKAEFWSYTSGLEQIIT